MPVPIAPALPSSQTARVQTPVAVTRPAESRAAYDANMAINLPWDLSLWLEEGVSGDSSSGGHNRCNKRCGLRNVRVPGEWMDDTPTGFRLVNGQLTDINVWQALGNPAGLPQAIHMILASYCAAGFATAGVHALLALRDRSNRFHQRAIAIALLVGGSAAIAQAVSGDVLARMTARNQPTKLAAMEGDFDTRRGAPLRIGDLPDVRTRQTKYSIEIPDGLSLLAFHSPHATVMGLDKTAPDEWPNVLVVHIAFQIMVGLGTLLICVSLVAAWLAWRHGPLIENPRFLQLLVLCSPLGFVALESGWVVTEVGRQPWIIYHIMKTSDAVTTMPGLTIPMVLFTGLYLILAAIVIWLMIKHVIASPSEAEIRALVENEVLLHARP
jgi:cytochrome bd ubiquinol oxidase subunit I